jgi:hypothetical protein
MRLSTALPAHLALLFCVGLLPAQSQPDIYDTVCVTYRLDAAQEAQFSATDGQLAPFWGVWDSLNASTLTRDYILMDPAHHAQPGRDYYTGPEDNSLYIRAAYGQQGLYLLVEMVDDDFIDRRDTNDDTLHQDVIELYLDTLSSREIVAGGDIFVGLYSSTLTFTTLQFVVSVGNTRTYDDFRVSYYDDALWSWTDNWPTFSEALATYGGMAFDFVTVSATRKAQEWFMPWSWAGNGGIPAGQPAEGKMMALAGGCHDMDMAQNDTICSLKWKNGANPWVAGDNWGDLEVGPMLSPGSTVASAPGIRQSPTFTAPRSFYTLTGRRLRGRPVGAATALVATHGPGAARLQVLPPARR